MSTYYIRKTGNDSNAGTSAGAAWLTIGKALGAAGIASGDTVWVGAGVYREVVTAAMTSATVETKINGDVDGSHTGDAGEVQWTAYTTNDTTAPSATTLLNLSARDFLTFQDIVFIGGAAIIVTANSVSTDTTFRRCQFVTGGTGASGNSINMTTAANTLSNWVIDSCYFAKGGSSLIGFTLTRSTGADFNCNIVIKNCLFAAGGSGGNIVSVASTGANAFNTGGITIYNCSILGSGGIATTSATLSTTYPINVYNCFFTGGGNVFNANTSGHIVEDYNVIMGGATPRTNVTAGTHSISDGSYAPLIYMGGHERFCIGSQLMPFGMPKPGSPLLGYGNQASSPVVDIAGAARPSATLASIGCYELGQGAVKETSTVRTGSNAIKIAGYGYQDFDIPVDAASTTVTVYARYDSSYAGTLPSMNIINGTECGVANATATQAGAVNTWELLSLNFTPTAQGIITIRLISLSTASAGNSFWDDFNVV